MKCLHILSKIGIFTEKSRHVAVCLRLEKAENLHQTKQKVKFPLPISADRLNK